MHAQHSTHLLLARHLEKGRAEELARLALSAHSHLAFANGLEMLSHRGFRGRERQLAQEDDQLLRRQCRTAAADAAAAIIRDHCVVINISL